ncbi:MAG TPA: DUF885 domain-containing protein [Candidatus Eisenbacteria bacterium]|nr:DUF885 domain-containing protein [Candidatus Eisenbacteria bacterium]
MRRGKRKIAWAMGVLLLALAVFLVPTIWLKPWSVEHYYMRVFLEFAVRHPMLMTSMGMLDGTPLDFYSHKLDDFSPEAEEREIRFLERQIDVLHQYDRTKLPSKQRLSYDVLDWFLTNQKENARFADHDYPVNQLFGFQSQLPDFMMNTHPLKKPRDAENYVKRISKFGVAFDQTLRGLRHREAKGIVPPRFVVQKVLDQMNGLIGKPARENPLYTHFVTRTDSMAKLKPADRDRLRARLEREIEQTVYPAYRRMIAYEDSLLARANDDDGVWKLPDGDVYYDRCLASHTTTRMPADSIHALGRREVDRIQGSMMAILAAQGYRVPDLASTVRRVFAEPRFQFPDGDEGRDAIIAGYQAILDEAAPRLDALFGVRPKARLEVKRVPPFKEATSAGAYYQRPSMDGKRPGVFYANLRDPHETHRPDMRTLAYHEGVPGHHFQISVQNELTGVPFFRKMIPFTAYAEGWGLYAERLALENGFHQDAFDSLGALQAELFRAVRLVVDTGIHRARWTREQAIDYMLSNTGMDSTEVVREIERYIVNPGQACAYKVGQLDILRLREDARRRLGGRFDVRRFHDVVLSNGALPLSLLERTVDEWVQDELKRPAVTDRG